MRSRQQRHQRPSHPNPTFVTIAKRPLVSGRDGDNEQVSWVKSEAEYFCEEGWTLICCVARRGWASIRGGSGAVERYFFGRCAGRWRWNLPIARAEISE